MTLLGLLNFLVLQWFGVRLARQFVHVQVDLQPAHVWLTSDGLSLGSIARTELRRDGWKLLRWVWPLTGWWSEYRWIARRR